MTSLGMKIVGSEFEAGFTAGTREEFDSFIARLTLMADSVWPKVETAHVGDGVKVRNLGGGAYETISPSAAPVRWKEDQGLR